MGDTTKTWLIYNGASGSHDDAALTELVAALEAAGHRPAQTLDCKDGTPDVATAEAERLGLIVIHGGDGTLSRTIGGLEGFSGRVLPLPGGTFNLLSRTIFGERTALEIAQLLAEGRLAAMRRSCIRGEGVLAIAELLAGPGAKWADVREELREANIGEVIAKGWDAATTSTVGPMIALTQPDKGREGGYAGVRLVPSARGMAIEGYAAEGLGDYVQAGLAILKRDFREGPHDNLGRRKKVALRSLTDDPIALMVDGERSEGDSEMRFSLDTLGVDLLGLPNDR